MALTTEAQKEKFQTQLITALDKLHAEADAAMQELCHLVKQNLPDLELNNVNTADQLQEAIIDLRPELDKKPVNKFAKDFWPKLEAAQQAAANASVVNQTKATLSQQPSFPPRLPRVSPPPNASAALPITDGEAFLLKLKGTRENSQNDPWKTHEDVEASISMKDNKHVCTYTGGEKEERITYDPSTSRIHIHSLNEATIEDTFAVVRETLLDKNEPYMEVATNDPLYLAACVKHAQAFEGKDGLKLIIKNNDGVLYEEADLKAALEEHHQDVADELGNDFSKYFSHYTPPTQSAQPT